MRLSLVIPAYNVEKYIRRTLISLIGQTHQGFETVIVDDGSTDNTLSVVSETLANHPLDAKIIRQENGGVSSARNNGLRHALGDYVVFLDGDDYLANTAVKDMLDAADSCNEADCICWKSTRVTESEAANSTFQSDSDRLEYLTLSGSEALKHIICEGSMQICTGSVAFRRDMLLRYGLEYTPGCSNGEDQEFGYKALSHVRQLVWINRINIFYLQRSGSITNRFDLSRFDSLNAMKRTSAYLSASDNPEILAVSDHIRNILMIQDYFYNLESCYVNSGMKAKEFLNYIDAHFQGLAKDMIGYMNHHDKVRLKLRLKMCIFKISPALLLWLVKALRLRTTV